MSAASLGMLLNVAAALTGGAAFALILWGSTVQQSARRESRSRLDAFTSDSSNPLFTEATAPRPPLMALVATLGSVLDWFPERWIRALRRQTIRAGQPVAMAEVFVGVRLISLVLGVLLWVGLASAASQHDNPFAPLVGLAGLLAVVLAASATDVCLLARGAARRRAAEAQLPTVVDLVHLSVAAGMGFEPALQSILRRMRGPLADELRCCVRDFTQLGVPLPAALNGVCERLGDPPDVHDFVGAVAHAHLLGTGLLPALATQSSLLRQERRRRAAVAAQRAPIRMLFPMTLFMLPVLMMIVLAPVLLRLFSRLSSIPGV